jgi:hypothetical protein
MDEDRNNEPGERLKNILAADKEDENASLKSLPQTQSPLEKLPRLKPVEQMPPQVDVKGDMPKPAMPVSPANLGNLPTSKQPVQSVQQPVQQTSKQAATSQTTQDMPRQEKLLRALWTMTSLISMAVNVVAIIVIIVMIWAYRDIKLPEEINITMVNKLLSGLYSNFEKMDRATIETVIPVDAQIPLDIIVPVQTTTQITLSETVNIPNAQVVINTGGLNINSTARVTLPAGTPLTVNLNFDLPVQDTIPVHLDVPVKIPMAETELHEPFVGLQDVVQPLYCLVDPSASNLDGQVICR